MPQERAIFSLASFLELNTSSITFVYCKENMHPCNLRLVLSYREATSRMKEGEEEKTKTYSALIWTEKTIDSSDLHFLENIKVFKSILISVCAGDESKNELMIVCVCVCI